MSITISCKEYAAQEKERIKEKAKGKGYSLHIFQIGDNAASDSYLKGKIKDCSDVDINVILHKYQEDPDEKYNDIYREIDIANEDKGGTFIQLPVPKNFDLDWAIMSITNAHDVDGLKPNSWHYPCTPRGIMDWLVANNINLCGKNVCIIGRSDIVGKPLAKMMTDKDATVTLCHSKTVKLEEYMKIADIIVSAVGKAKFIHDIDLPRKPIMIDVGINRDENGKLCGDVDYENMLDTCEYITPVPSGVGLLTRVSLLKNIVRL